MSPTVACPALLIAAPSSGQGKTTVIAALARLHARRGRRVAVFKCGPDFLDPHWLALASGRSVHQIDLWMTGEDDIRRRLHEAAGNADLILIEGVMGMFDGTPSAADIAEKFGVPVMGVIDASAMAGTFGALALGLRTYQPGVRWAGVLANRVASAHHAQMLQNSLREADTWLGSIERNASFSLPERHLGLTVALEVTDALQRLDAVADLLEGTPLGAMTTQALQQWSVEFRPAAHDAGHDAALAAALATALSGKTIAVARDAAFCFLYQANLDVLQGMGASLEFFSPLADAAVPACDAVWLPGGYPELHGRAIGDNTAMRDSLKAHVAAGRPVWAECGGMMALFDELTLADGTAWPMWGLLPGKVRMQARLAALGPRQLSLGAETLRGHTFHYSVTETGLPVLAQAVRPGAPAGAAGEAFYRQGPIRASYFHPWFASNPQAAARLFLDEAQA